mgnify:CR=1 FL=1
MTKILWIPAGADVPAFAADTLLVWHGRLDAPGAVALASRAALMPDDLADLASRAGTSWHAARRKVVRALVATWAGLHPDTIVLRRSPFGAVKVAAPDGWGLSVAGRGRQCAIAIARGSVGVDIEPVDQPPLPDDLFTARERHAGGDRLLRWTMKEAHAKCFGRADAADPCAIETVLRVGVACAVSTDGYTWCFSHRCGSAVVTVACPVNRTV